MQYTLPEGYALETGWDEAGRLVRLHDAPGAIDVSLHYDDPRHPQRATSASQSDGERHWTLMRWAYNARGQLAAVTDATELTRREYRYNDDGLMVWHRNAAGFESEYRWEMFDHWRVIENRTNTGDGCRFEYDLDAGLTTVTHYDGHTRQHYWNAQGLIVRFVDERGENWRFEWDDNEQLIRRVDALGHAMAFVYDDMGNRVQEIDAAGNARATQWLDNRALPGVITEPGCAATRFYYDEHFGLARTVDALGNTIFLKKCAPSSYQERF